MCSQALIGKAFWPLKIFSDRKSFKNSYRCKRSRNTIIVKFFVIDVFFSAQSFGKKIVVKRGHTRCLKTQKKHN